MCLLAWWQSSGSPPSAFHVPYDSFREQPSSVDHSHDVNSSSDGSKENKSKELDFEFICFFLSSQRLELYRSIDLRCEDMLLGKPCHWTSAWFYFFIKDLIAWIKHSLLSLAKVLGFTFRWSFTCEPWYYFRFPLPYVMI